MQDSGRVQLNRRERITSVFFYLLALVGIISRATRCDIIKVPASTKPMSRILLWRKGKKGHLTLFMPFGPDFNSVDRDR
jgi:hypothetical protein